MTVTRNGVLRFFHIGNFENASAEELNFLRLLHFRLHANIKHLAREAGGQADRAAQAVIEAMAGMCDNVTWP